MESLPLEITSNILLRLPIKTLGQLKCVSKTLKTLITSPYFTKTHHTQTPSALRRHQLLFATSSLHTLVIFLSENQQTPRPHYLHIPSNPVKNYCGAIELVGSCNGLVCLFYPPATYSLLNPTTRESRVLPDSGTSRIRLSGFGYVTKFDDYMVVCVSSDEFAMRVFSAKADSWRTIRRSWVSLTVIPWVKPVYVNSVVHWLSFDSDSLPVHNIMGFDFVDEELKVLPLCEDMSNRLTTALGVLGGCVCALSVEGHNTDLDMWVMMEYGDRESWMRLFELPIVYPHSPFVSISPICYVGYEILFLADSRCLMLSDLVDGTLRILEVELQGRGGSADLHVAAYEESLVSPYDYVCQDEGRYIGVSGKEVKLLEKSW